jgi:hypothetical protein
MSVKLMKVSVEGSDLIQICYEFFGKPENRPEKKG